MRSVWSVCWRSMGGTAIALVVASAGRPQGLAAQDRPAPAPTAAEATAAAAPASAPPEADPADVESIDAIIAAIYDVISGEKGEARDWDRFRSLHIPEARLIPSGRNQEGRHGYVVWSPETYIETAGASLEANGFFEDEAHRVVEQWADIAHVFSTYNSYHTAADMDAGNHFTRGINSFQLMYDGTRWYIVSIMWEAEAPGRPIADKYLDGM